MVEEYCRGCLEASAGLALNPVPDSVFSRMAACFPWNGSKLEMCRTVLRDLVGCGVESLVSWGSITLPWGRVLGKGHASIVSLGYYDNRIVAVKIRRTDSKHKSFQSEGILQESAWRAGVAPRVYCYRDNVIVMDLLEGIPLGDLPVLTKGDVSVILSSAYALDKAGIHHHEISRPWKHVYLTDANAVIIDFGSSSYGYCRNLPSITGSLLRRVGIEISESLKSLLSTYKHGCNSRLYLSIRDFVLGYFN
ncbi:MAG: hypothetical protein F7B59_04360 [Desulfurococcales archaeon]|nr:hypothetical protein [Desulfurococcales archaeon]